jgi:Tol biopolymer transport system component
MNPRPASPSAAPTLLLLLAAAVALAAALAAGPGSASAEEPAPKPPAAPAAGDGAAPPAGPPAAFAGTGLRKVADDPREKHLRNVRQLTFEGENAEAYWSSDASMLVFQHRGAGIPADQIYTIRADGTGLRLASTGTGKCTCSYFMPGDRRVLFASTHGASPKPPPPPDMSKGYVWPIYPEYDLWTANLDGSDLRRLTDSPGYDAEAVVSPDGKRIVFTSMRDGDLDVYTMNVDGTDVRRVTNELGYDGGAFFSPDGKRLVYRGWHPKGPKEEEDYRSLLAAHRIRPLALQIRTCDPDGRNAVQVTDNRGANFGPFFHPDGRRIIFASNMDDPKGREFDIYIVNADGTGLERVTFMPEFDGFPMFTRDGKTLVFCSNRYGAQKGNTNVFIADWVE